MNLKSQLNKKSIFLNKKTLTDRQSPIVRIGNEYYTLRKLYIIKKGNLINEINNKRVSLYLKTKININKDVAYTKPLIEDIIVGSYRELVMFVINFCQIKDINKYKIIIFNSDLHSIENNEQLMNYKETIIYAKINENIKQKESEKNNNFITIKKILNKRILSTKERDDKGNIINNSNKSILSSKKSVKSSFLIFRPKNYSTYAINNKVFNMSFKSSLSKNTSFSLDKSKNNNYNSKILFKKKLNKISLKYPHNSFELKKEENETHNISYKINTNQFNEILRAKNKSKINEFSNVNFNDSLMNIKFNKSKSEFEFFRKNQRLNQKIFDTEKIFKSVNSTKNAGIQVMNIEKSFYRRQNYLYNNFFNKIIKRHNYSTFLAKNKYNSFFDLKKKNELVINNLTKIKKMKMNNTIIDKNKILKNSKQFTNLKTIYKYLKYPKLKEQEQEKKEYKNEKDSINNSLHKMKEIYDESLYEIGTIINNINDYFPDITEFIEQIEFSFKNKYKYINIFKCLKLYLLYSFIENFIINKKDLSLLSLYNIFEGSVTEDDYKKTETLLQYILEKIIKTRENKTFDLINFVQSKKYIDDFAISKKFFFVFIMCSNYFDKNQRDIGKRMLLTLEIEEKLTYKDYVKYYLYFEDNRSLKLENKLNFITKFLFIVDSGCYEEKDPKLVKKFINKVQFIFRIDDRSKKILLNNGNIQSTDMTLAMIRKINKVFYSIINFFGNNFFNTTQIMSLN